MIHDPGASSSRHQPLPLSTSSLGPPQSETRLKIQRNPQGVSVATLTAGQRRAVAARDLADVEDEWAALADSGAGAAAIQAYPVG